MQEDARTRDRNQRPKIIEEKKDCREVSRSDLAFLSLLGGSVGEKGRTKFGEYLIPEFGDAPYDGEDDAFSDQNTEHIGGNLATILGRVEEFIGFV